MGLDNLPKLGLSQTVKEKEINIQDMDLFNRGSLSNLRNRLLSDDASERRYMFDDCIDMIGQVVSANVEQFKNHHNNKQNTFHKENREIQRLLYLEGNESDIESILKLTFWTNKMAKTYNEVLSSEKEILGQEELVYFERGETWSYALKNEFMSTLIYLLIKDNYSEVKSWGFRKGKNPILIIDYPGYNFPISFHLGKYPENILPRELGELVFDKTKDDFKYPFDIKPKGNSVSHKLNEQEKTDYQRDFDNEQTFKSLEKIQKHQILVGLGKISELETLYSIKLPLEGSLNIELDKNFLTIKDFEFRKKLEEMIIKKKGVIYIQKGNRLSKHAIEYSLNNWWKENYSDRSDLEFRETRPGEIFPGEINIDNTKKSGEPFQIREDGTICIDSIRDRRMGTRSSIQNLARLGFYFPQQIIDYANNPKFSEMMIDPNYGFVYANFGYLRGKRLFDFAEEGLLDKKLTPEDFQRYGLKEAYEKQKQIYETSLKEIMENTEFFEGKDIKNEKIKVAIVSKEVMSGSYICYYKYDCDYYVSFEIVSENKVKFSCMVNREKGIEKLPDKMVQKMRLINEKLKRNIRKEEIYIQENNQMIYIGGYKNPNNLLYVSDLLDVDSNTYDSKELAGKLTEFFKEGFFDT